MRSFRTLEVWQKAHFLTVKVYQQTKGFPKSELFGLINQIRRASASIPSNIAEGCGQGTQAGFARYLQIAVGSSDEVEYQLLLSHDLGYLPREAYGLLQPEVVAIRQTFIRLASTVRDSSRSTRKTRR